MTASSDKQFLLDDLPAQADVLKRAVAMQKKAASVGFDWSEIDGVFAKISEELVELRAEITANSDKEKLHDELGDVLFACCNLARHLELDPVFALNQTNQKFYRRFNFVETCISARQKQFSDFSLQELDEFWEQAKTLEQFDDDD